MYIYFYSYKLIKYLKKTQLKFVPDQKFQTLFIAINIEYKNIEVYFKDRYKLNR